MNDGEADQSAAVDRAAAPGRPVGAPRRRELLLADAVLAQTDDAIILTSAEGIVSFWNHGAERLYG